MLATAETKFTVFNPQQIFFGVMKSRSVENVTCMGQKRHSWRVLTRKPEEKNTGF